MELRHQNELTACGIEAERVLRTREVGLVPTRFLRSLRGCWAIAGQGGLSLQFGLVGALLFTNLTERPTCELMN